MSGAGVSPGERARVLLMRGDELLASNSPESLDEALLAFEGGLEVAREPDVEDGELAGVFEERIATVRARLEGGAAEGEDEEVDSDAERPGGERPDGERPGAGDAGSDPAGEKPSGGAEAGERR